MATDRTGVVRFARRRAETESRPKCHDWVVVRTAPVSMATTAEVVSAGYDHLLPHNRGGSADLENIVVTCAPCNFSRMDLTLDEVRVVDPRTREPVRPAWIGELLFDFSARLLADAPAGSWLLPITRWPGSGKLAETGSGYGAIVQRSGAAIGIGRARQSSPMTRASSSDAAPLTCRLSQESHPRNPLWWRRHRPVRLGPYAEGWPPEACPRGRPEGPAWHRRRQ